MKQEQDRDDPSIDDVESEAKARGRGVVGGGVGEKEAIARVL